MKLRTSFFNPTVLKKDITRFAPVWALYSVFLLLSLMLLSDSDFPVRNAKSINEFCASGSIIQLVYGGICGALLFGDLFQSRMCYALHTMPLRREGWFLTHLVAGVLFFLVPTSLFCLLIMLRTGAYWYLSLIFLAVSFLMFLFFFGVSAFCAMCAGNRLATVALYGIVNFISLFVYCLTIVFYEQFLYGVTISSKPFLHYSPALALSSCNFVDFDYVNVYHPMETVEILWEQWRYLGWTALFGLVFLTLAVLIYRCRNLEAAGDFISAKPVEPVFLGIFCLSAGMLLYFLVDIINGVQSGSIIFLGIVVGFFSGRMLLQRTVRVFQPKSFLALGCIIVVLALSMWAMAQDIFGIVRRVPEKQQVEKVRIWLSNSWGNDLELTEEEDIEKIVNLHNACVEVRSTGTIQMGMEYTLKGGGTLERMYLVPSNTVETENMRQYFSSWQCIFGTDDWEGFKNGILHIYAYGDDGEDVLPYGAYDELLEAIRRDCEAGNMVQHYDYHNNEDNEYWIEISWREGKAAQRENWITLNIFTSCNNTRAVLKKYQEG